MKNMTLVEFVKATSSKNPVPGGGSVAALCGAKMLQYYKKLY